MFCTNCGQENKDGAKFCTGCGAPLVTEEPLAGFDPGPEPWPHPSTPHRMHPGAVAAIVVAVLLAVAGAACGVMFALKVGPFAEAPQPAATQPAATPEETPAPGSGSGETPEPETKTEPAPEAEPEPDPEPETVTVSHYQLVHECMTWDEARQYCEDSGGHLVTISSADELDEVLSQLPAEGLVSCWIGAYRTSDGGWAWVDGSEFSYASWAAGEPNNDGGTENYATLLKVDGSWAMYDVPGDVSGFYQDDKIGFVMETEEQVPVS